MEQSYWWITYADGAQFEACVKPAEAYARKHHSAAHFHCYKRSDLSTRFLAHNRKIMNTARGKGLWVWKPYILLNALRTVVPEDELLVYCDVGTAITTERDIYSYLPDNQSLLMLSIDDQIERRWCKQSAIDLIGASDEALDKTQRMGGVLLMRNTDEVRQFVSAWLQWCCDERIVDDTLTDVDVQRKQKDEFCENRHDQTALSLLSKKTQLPIYVLKGMPIAQRYFLRS